MINIVLFEPEIPFNTANIIRTCVATNSRLHIIKPTGFDMEREHKDLKRGSTNFLEDVELVMHESFNDFAKVKNGDPLYILTRYGKDVYSNIEYNDYNQDVYIMFGKESSGIPEEIMSKYKENLFRIPMHKKMRSLNLSNCAALVTYDLLRKVDFALLEKEEL